MSASMDKANRITKYMLLKAGGRGVSAVPGRELPCGKSYMMCWQRSCRVLYRVTWCADRGHV